MKAAIKALICAVIVRFSERGHTAMRIVRSVWPGFRDA
jgi:hypothetical protein